MIENEGKNSPPLLFINTNRGLDAGPAEYRTFIKLGVQKGRKLTIQQ